MLIGIDCPGGYQGVSGLFESRRRIAAIPPPITISDIDVRSPHRDHTAPTRGHKDQDSEKQEPRTVSGFLSRDPLVRAALASFLTFAVVFRGAFSYYYVKYERIIAHRFKGQVFSNSAKIYAIPEVVRMWARKDRSKEIAGELRRQVIPKRRAILDGQLSPGQGRDSRLNRVRSPITARSRQQYVSPMESGKHHRQLRATLKPTNSNPNW